MEAILFILDIKDVPKDQEYLVLSLRLEEQRLFTWGEVVGLVTDDAGASVEFGTGQSVFGAHRGLVLDLLVQINVLFDDFQKHQVRHKRLKETKKDTEAVAVTAVEDTMSERKRKFLKEAMESAKSKGGESWKRVRWAAFDMKDFKALIRQFSALNDSITDLLDSKLQRNIARTTQDIYREVLQMATEQKQLKNIIDAAGFGQRVHGSQEKGLKTLMELASFKAFYRSVDDEEMDASANELEEDGRHKMEISPLQIQLEEKRDDGKYLYHDTRLKGVYSQANTDVSITLQQVWIEWKIYPSMDGVYLPECRQSPQAKCFQRASTLAQLLSAEEKPKEFRVPQCLGYFDGREYNQQHGQPIVPRKFGFVYAMPDTIPPGSRPRSLRQLLGDATVSKPDIGDRVAMARALATSLLYLHTVEWFGKSLRSDNVIFFTIDASHGEEIDYANPIHSGFDCVERMESIEEKYHTEAPCNDVHAQLYLHPETSKDSKEPYRKSFDIYSLGVVFVELAFWMPIEDVLAKYDKMHFKKANPTWDETDPKQRPRPLTIFDVQYAVSRPSQIKAIRSKLLHQDLVAGIGSEMGRMFKDLTWTCLKGGEELNLKPDDDEALPSVGAKVSGAYWEKVVRQLEEIRV